MGNEIKRREKIFMESSFGVLWDFNIGQDPIQHYSGAWTGCGR